MKNSVSFLSVLTLALFLGCQLFAQQNLQDQIKQITNQNRSYQKLGKTYLDLASLRKLYELRSYQQIWIEGNRLNSLAINFLEILKSPEEFGFDKSEFWDKELENTVSKIEKSGIEESAKPWYDLYFSDIAIKFAKNLWQGRNLDPELVDDDTKFKRKNFDKYTILNQILSTANNQDLKVQIELLEPKNWIYKKMKTVMKQVLVAEQKGSWKKIEVTKESRKPGSKSPQIIDLKRQMSLYGFKLQGADVGVFTDEYDEELTKAIEQYHQLYKTGGTGLNDTLLRSMNNTLDSRKAQVRVAMEKARWLPDELEATHIFVNLGFQEFKLFDNNQLALEMKTINGQKFRRTPMMRDMVTVVELNPTWTVPYSIAVKDKLPKLRLNPNYLSEHHMKLIDNASGEELDATQIDWDQIEKEDFKFTIVQGSGADNALGLVKFPLTNPWSIYMHDTNERDLFSKPQRLLSSGCMRLEKPFEFANYLLKDRTEFAPEKIKEIVENALANPTDITPTRIKVKKSIPVYTLFLTVDQSSDGIMRFADDFYGSDSRLKGIIENQNKFEIKTAASEYISEQALAPNEGVLSFVGKIGEQQLTKTVDLYKCIKNKKRSCELAASLELGKSYKLAVGDYLAVYENSLSPDFISVQAAKNQKIKLLSIQTPDVLKEETDLKLFKDISQDEEQNKILKEIFYFKSSPFKYSQVENDFLFSSARAKVINQRYEYSYCLNNYSALSDEAKELCDVYKNASDEKALADLVSFENLSSGGKLSAGEYYQMWITKPGDRVKVLNKRILMSAPYLGRETVLVFPGRYKLQSDSKKLTVDIVAK